MTADVEQAKEAVRLCRKHRDAGELEAVLRSEFDSRLRLIFPSADDQGWINHYTAGTETPVTVGRAGSGTVRRFIDVLIGATTIEYEADLRVPARYREGFAQVEEHVTGLIRRGVPVSRVRGVLSDTVKWCAYDVVLTPGVDPENCTPDDVSLSLIDELELGTADTIAAERLIRFLRKHLARQQSRPLKADFLTTDLGLASGLHERSAIPLHELIEEGRACTSAIELATDLWSQFVDHLASHKGGFRPEAYADEVYLLVIARLLSANVVAGEALLSANDEIQAILDGAYFRHHIDNMVDSDYFGWLTTSPYVDRLIPIAAEIQRDLYAYDFGSRPEEDLFGRLMAQLARRSQRKLLGQEWTPSWLARLLVERCLDNLPGDEPPRIVDMCCGSGTILTEVLKVAKVRLGLAGIEALRDVATGFDIDPLAVSLAKTAWVVTLAPEIQEAGAPVTIPIYHADSLFAVTPVSAVLPEPGKEDAVEMALDGVSLKLPHDLLQPRYRHLFDRIVDWVYDEARDAPAHCAAFRFSERQVAAFLDAEDDALSPELREALVPAVRALINRMVELAAAGRNGIWAFILRNTHRPGLLTGQFNGLVSNPPWLAMSGVADNPYRAVLTGRAEIYGLKPAGPSFLHLELATTHLLHAVDRYLKPEASVACLVPGTVFNGHHHEPLRRGRFRSSPRPVGLEIHEVWQVAPGTFKYPGAAIVGRKRGSVAALDVEPTGALATVNGLEEIDLSVHEVGAKRTAWVLAKEGVPAVADGAQEPLQQGADLMPRTAVCVEIRKDNRSEYQVHTPYKDSPWGFAVKAAKELKEDRFPGQVAPCFIHRMAHSENLLPFLLRDQCPPIAIPAERRSDGHWRIYDELEIRRMGWVGTARRFRAINTRLKTVGQGKTLQERIDERGKLVRQVFGDEGHLIVAGAGGKYICAACLPLADARDWVIDQTLYWKVTGLANEAWFLVAMLNSHAMTEAIAPFNPKGEFGERHIHTLPYRLMPAFDPANDDHRHAAALAREIAVVAKAVVAEDEYLRDPNRALHVRRARLRQRLLTAVQMKDLELLCAGALGVTPAGG